MITKGGNENERPIQARLVELYLECCGYVARMKSQMDQKQFSDVDFTFVKFRSRFIEMYMLSITLKDMKNSEMLKKVKTWRSKPMVRHNVKYYMYSVDLFESYVCELFERGKILS